MTDERDWSSYEPEPQAVGTFARTLADTAPEGFWDEYAMVGEAGAIAGPHGWFVPLVESRTTAREEAAAFADVAEAALRAEHGEPVDRAPVRGWSSATWLDAVTVALGADRLLTWDVDGIRVSLVRAASGDALDVWLVAVTPGAASVPLPELLGGVAAEPDGPTEPGTPLDEVTRLLRWVRDHRVNVGVEPGGSLEGWFPDTVPASELERLTPFAVVDGTGSVGALWTDDEGRSLVVVLGSEGDRFVLADSPADLARLLAVGFEEVTDAGGVPDGIIGALRAAPLRAWVEETYAVEVPREWVAGGPDEFSEWVDGLLGEATGRTAPPAGLPAGAVPGDVEVLLAALGRTDAVATIAAHLGLPATTTARDLQRVGVEVGLDRRGPQTIWVKTRQYPRPDQLFADLPVTATSPEIVARYGTPEQQHPEGDWVRYVVGDRYLHVAEGNRGIARVTVMLSAP